MGPAWAHAFLVATLLTLAGTPLLRRVALATEFVDHPVAAHKSHRTPTPYLGGVGLITAVLVGLAFTSRLNTQVGVIALGGSFIGCLGLVDDHRSVGALFRFVVEGVIAVAVLGTGLRIHATDIPTIDGVITVVWIVGVTNAVNLLDNMDGLAAGVSSAAAGAIFALAVLGEQRVTATIAAALAGACLGFLFHNKRPATIFMGDTGSLFLGFVLATVAIDVSPALNPPTSFAVPLLLLALPVLDTATVTVSRLRRGRSVSQGGKDHLSHRLVARGLLPSAAVRALVTVELAVGMLAVLAGRDVLPLGAAVLLAVALLAALSWFTLGATVYAEPVVGVSKRLCAAAAGAVVATVGLATPAALALVRAKGPGNTGASAATEGLAALESGDSAGAAVHFAEAATALGRAERILGGRLTSLGLLLPGVRANVATARALVAAGQGTADAAARLSSVVEASNLRLDAAADPAGRADALVPALTDSASVLRRSAAQLAGYDRPYLWPTLGDKVVTLRLGLLQAASRASLAAEAARLSPPMMGTAGARHYFLAVLDNAELRGTGGVPYLWGEVVAENGRLRLDHLGPIDELETQGQKHTLEAPGDFADRYRDFDIADTWQNVSVSPDFAVTGSVIEGLYEQSRGRRLDGVIAIDLPGLASLLDLTGPVAVAGWDVPVTRSNVTGLVLRDSFLRFPADADRRAFVMRLVTQVVQAFANADLGTPSRVVGTLAGIASDGHLALYAERGDEQLLVERIGAAGRPDTAVGDSVFVVNENLSGSGIDAFLHRSIRYDVRLDPGPQPAALSGRVSVVLRNDAPSAGLPQAVIGPYDLRYKPGENKTFVSIYSPLALTGPRQDLVSGPELGVRAYSSIVAIPSGESRTVTVDLEGRMALSQGALYRLNLPHQPVLNPDDTDVLVSVPGGWRITGVEGLRKVDARHAVASLSVSGPRSVGLRVERTAWSRLWSSER